MTLAKAGSIIKKVINKLTIYPAKVKKVQADIFGWSKTGDGEGVITLKEIGGKERELLIGIGPFEMESILLFFKIEAGEIEAFKRPLTYDLFLRTLGEIGCELKEIVITKIEDEIFYAVLHIEDQEIDARPSDAINLALRAGAPIYVAENVFAEYYAISEISENIEKSYTSQPLEEGYKNDEIMNISKLTVDELQKKLEEAIRKENYELAVKIRDELQKRRPKKN